MNGYAVAVTMVVLAFLAMTCNCEAESGTTTTRRMVIRGPGKVVRQMDQNTSPTLEQQLDQLRYGPEGPPKMRNVERTPMLHDAWPKANPGIDREKLRPSKK